MCGLGRVVPPPLIVLFISSWSFDPPEKASPIALPCEGLIYLLPQYVEWLFDKNPVLTTFFVGDRAHRAVKLALMSIQV